MEFAILIVLIFAGVVGVTIYSKRQSIKTLHARILTAFGNMPDADDMDMDSIRAYANRAPEHDLRIDKITWSDLDMDSVYKRVNACFSSVGEEYLYNCLHEPQFNEEILHTREEIMNFFDQRPNQRVAAQFALARLGKSRHNGVAALIFNADIKMLPRHLLFKILAATPLVFAAVLPFSLTVGIMGLILSFIVNLAFYYNAMRFVDLEMPAIGYFASMVGCVGRLYGIKGLGGLPIMKNLEKPYIIYKNAIKKAPSGKGMGADITDLFWTYFNIMFLIDVRRYNNFMQLVAKNGDAFHEIYKTIGEIDTALAVLSFRKSLPFHSTPQFSDKNELAFDNIYHPLIKQPVTNTHIFNSDSLITGSNASGKSTFIKTLAINGILAQTIYTCTATKFATRFAMVVTSMAMRDDLLGGESYFIVEINSLKRVLDMVAKYPCVCYVDEILRGTNTAERIAASAAILTHLYSQDCLCVVASHDIELTRLLSHANYHFCEQVTDGDIVFDYKLKKGPTTTRNAIKLLEVMGFNPDIVSQANNLAGN